MEKEHAEAVVFITITRGFLVRNILRSGVLQKLLDRGAKVVVLFPLIEGQTEVDPSLRAEFQHPSVVLEGVVDRSPRGYSFFGKYASMLLYSRTTWAYSKVGNTTKMQRAALWKYLERGIYSVLSVFKPLKLLVRFLEERYFYVPEYESYFDTYKPTVVFGTSIVSRFDILFMKAARRRGIRTVAMPKGWDNVVKMLYRFIPDIILVQNTLMKEGLVSAQGASPDQVVVVGFPQFDWHKNLDLVLPREVFLKSLGIPPEHKLIMFGSEGVWAPTDKKIADVLARWVGGTEAFDVPATLIVRPHYSDVRSHKFDSLKNLPQVLVDSHINVSDFFMDNWNPHMEEVAYFVNLMHHADVVISIASTLALDAACSGTPILSPFFGGLMDKSKTKDITHVLFETDHYQWVLNTGAALKAYTEEQMREGIQTYFHNRSYLAHERERLVSELCFGNDGKASTRIVDVLLRYN